MKSQKIALACSTFAVLMVLSLLPAAAVSAADPTGTWIGKWDDPHSGTSELTFVLKKTATGYHGVLNDTLGLVPKDTEVKDFKVEGDSVKFSFFIPSSDGDVECSMALKWSGDTMAGELIWVAKGGGIPFEFVRKK